MISNWFWKIYSLIGLILAVYTALAMMASDVARGPLVLTPGAQTSLSIFSLASSGLSLGGAFPDTGKKSWLDTSEYEPVTLSVTKNTGEAMIFHAYRVEGKSWNPERLYRSFFPIEPDNPTKDSFPRQSYKNLQREFGWENFNIKVEYVHHNLIDTEISIFIRPQLGLKMSSGSVAWLFLGIFWPIYFMIYAVIGASVWFFIWRARRHKAAEI